MVELQPHVLILTGDGINTERELSQAFEQAGAHSKIIHVNDLLASPQELRQAQILAIPGGFSFGDDLGAGKILALKIKYQLQEAFQEWLEQKKPILGICNGFQVLVKMGLLPFGDLKQEMSLTTNQSGHFLNRWVKLEAPHSRCIWTRDLEHLSLPIRHAEGRLSFSEGLRLEQLKKQGQIALTYCEDVNGSLAQIAGLCDPSGLIFGLMPHPEAYTYELQRGRKGEQSFELAVGHKIFQNAVQFVRES